MKKILAAAALSAAISPAFAMNGGDWADLISIVVPAIAGAVVAANQPPPVPQAVVVEPVYVKQNAYNPDDNIPEFPLVNKWLESDGWVCAYSNGAHYRKQIGCLTFIN
jgi:hypothetical protein